MDVDVRIDELMRLSYAELGELSDCVSVDFVDEAGRKFQCITWCEPMGPESYRVVVSLHRIYVLGFSAFIRARGFSIDASGTIEVLDSAEVEELFL